MKKDCPMSPREIKNAETAYRAAASRMVLLENHNRVLPIKNAAPCLSISRADTISIFMTHTNFIHHPETHRRWIRRKCPTR